LVISFTKSPNSPIRQFTNFLSASDQRHDRTDSGPDRCANARTDPHPELGRLTVTTIARARACGRGPNRSSGRADHRAKAHGMAASPTSLRLVLGLETVGDEVFR